MGLGWLLPRSMLVLTTRGRMSGLPRHTMLEHIVNDGSVTLAAPGVPGRNGRNLAAVSAPRPGVALRAAGYGDFGRIDPADLRGELMRSRDPVANQISDATFLFWQIERQT